MTLDELSSLARRAYVTSESSNVLDGWRATVLAVLDAVERNCVPTQMIPATDYWDEGYNKSRDEMLDAIQTLRGGDDHDVYRTHHEGCESEHVSCLMRKLADEIERLREELAAAQKDADREGERA